MTWRSGKENFDRAQDFYATALQIYRDLDDQGGVIATLRGLGSVTIDLGDLDGAERLLSEVLAMAPLSGYDWESAAAANLLAIIHFAQGRFADGHHAGRACRSWRFRALGDVGHAAYAEISLARFALVPGTWLVSG